MKKVISLIVASLMMLCIFAGCTNGGTSDTGSGSSSQSSDTSSSSSSSSESTSKTDYLAWTMKEWKAASDSEKEDCTVAYLMYVAKLMGQEDKITEDQLRSQVDKTIDAVELLFKSIELGGFGNLKEAADAGFAALQSSND